MTLEKLKFLLGVTFSPPLHSKEEELERFYQTSVKPFLTLTYRFPDVQITLFISGSFLEWLSDHHSEYLAALAEMIKRKQVEMLGGGYFAPLLPLIPPTDRLGQIEELTTLVRKLLGRRPRGLWLTKTVWDPTLVVHLNGSGMEYTFLEESDFRRIGIPESQLPYPRVTENQGKLLTVFPFNAELSRKVEAGDFEAFRKEVAQRSQYEDGLLTLFFTLESLHPGDFFTRAENGLEAFLHLIRSFYPEIDGVNPGSFFKKNQTPLARSYFAGTTYSELCLRLGMPQRPSAAAQSWRQFLTDFEASNRLYCKMIYVHLLVSSLRGDKYKKKAAYEDLWKAQTAGGYFPLHEANGSLSSLRQRAFSSLINTEALLRDKVHFQAALTAQDFDLDGVREYLYQGKHSNFYVDAIGGQIFEWDCLEKPWNYVDAPSRDGGPLPQVFVDRFFSKGSPEKDAARFHQKEYKLVELNRDQMTLQLVAVDSLNGPQGRQPARIKKTYRFDEHSVELDYEVELLSGPSWEGWFSSDSTLSFSHPERVSFEPLGSVQDSVGAKAFDEQRGVHLHWEWDVAAHWSQAERVAPRWALRLVSGEIWRCQMKLSQKTAVSAGG